MMVRGRVACLFLLIGCTVLIVSSCRHHDSIRQPDSASDVVALEQQLAERDHELEVLRPVVARLYRESEDRRVVADAELPVGFIGQMAAPSVTGTVATVAGGICKITITENRDNRNLQREIADNLFSLAIYNDDGFKAEVVCAKLESETNSLLCYVMYAHEGAIIAVGDKATSK